MILLKELLIKENSPTGTFQMYHGGSRWTAKPEIFPPKKGRYEGGVGIYFTTHYLTARKYAKGGNVVHLVDIDANYRDIKNVRIPIKDMVDFVKNSHGLRAKKEIISNLVAYSERVGKNDIPAEILNNLIVNYEAGSGKAGLEVPKYLVSHGIDAYVYPQHNNEDWLIAFNPNIIKKVSVVDPSKLEVSSYELPRIFK